MSDDCMHKMLDWVVANNLCSFPHFTDKVFMVKKIPQNSWKLKPTRFLVIIPYSMGFCHKDFNVASHEIRNIKICYIFYLVTFYHMRFCNCLMLCLYFSISLRSKCMGFLPNPKGTLSIMHKSIQNSIVSAIGIY